MSLPGFAFEAVPFRWLTRDSLELEIGLERVPGYDPSAEDAADDALGFSGTWVMNGANQRAVLESFFNQVATGDSLVFVYLKHSPLQEARTERLLVGAARVTGVRLPPMWNQTGTPPFTSSMWETVVEHSLRPAMTDGILLPYQQLIPLLDDGIDVDPALAWAPEGRRAEFSYVTEHLTDDAAIEGLAALERAAHGMTELGVELPQNAMDWLTAQTERLWQMRGPVPGLAAVFAQIGVQQPHVAARALITEAGDTPPWTVLDRIFSKPGSAPTVIKPHLTATVARIWTKLPREHRDVLRLLSCFDITAGQVRMLMDGDTDVALDPVELLDNPYFACTCTYAMPEHIPFATIDRALFPPTHVTWTSPIPDTVQLDGHNDRRRVEALLTDVLERQGVQGDTVLPEVEAIDLANTVVLAQPPTLTKSILTGLDLDHDSLLVREGWSPLTSIRLGDGSSALKLDRFDTISTVIRDWVKTQQSRPRLGDVDDARNVLDEALSRNRNVTSPTPDATDDDALEDQARTEKAAGLSELHASPLSVLIGAAGTGKTTLLKALVEYPGVADGGVLLLAPTGKARVQLETKVGLPAKTLASYLAPTHRYDGATGRYVVWGDEQPHRNYGLVVIDEASMLTEEMLAAVLDAFGNVRRLVLVGDPRQLPPIGPGRPFVDLVDTLRTAVFESAIRVAPGYVELVVPRRQLPDGTHGTRHDLELAACFGDGTRGAAGDTIWSDLAETPDVRTVRYVSWGERTPIQALTDALHDELPLDRVADPEKAFALTYGGTLNGDWLNWESGAGAHAEDWQILSPTRSRAFGTVELNRHIKRTFRTGDTKFGQSNSRKSNIPAPIGPELIVRGDKVMQTINKKLTAFPKDPVALNYVANGEIGVAIGRMTKALVRAKKNLKLNVEFSSQPGVQYGYWPTDSEDALLELAWAVSVHKSQGSEFGTTFLILPARTNISRELMYTALTRQKDRVVILHDGTLAELRDLAQPWRSETARRLTDLFTAPDPVTIDVRGTARRYDRHLLHVAANGTPMASKNEVIIAGLLDRLVPGLWQYEQTLPGTDGRVILPDFTIAAPDGRIVFWEHAGMLDLPDYARKWELKKAWYAENGIRPHEDGGGPNGVLMWTDDRNGADAQAWLQYAEEVLGVTAGRGGPGKSQHGRRVAKKAAPRPPRR